LDLFQLRSQPFRDRDPLQPELSAFALPTDVREAQEIERLWLSDSPCRPSLGRIASELDQPGLVGMQFQTELRETSSEIVEELLGVPKMLEPDDEIIGKPRDDHVASGVPLPPLPAGRGLRTARPTLSSGAANEIFDHGPIAL